MVHFSSTALAAAMRAFFFSSFKSCGTNTRMKTSQMIMGILGNNVFSSVFHLMINMSSSDVLKRLTLMLLINITLLVICTLD